MSRWLLALTLWSMASRVHAVAIVDVIPSQSMVRIGQPFEVELRGSLSRPVLGWGLDLSYTAGSLAPQDIPEIGPAWIRINAADGDGLAGLAFPNPVFGVSLLLARIQFVALAPGTFSFIAGLTEGDLAEGFPLTPAGFEDDVRLGHATVVVVDESSTIELVGVACSLLIGLRNLTYPTRRWS